MAQVRALGRAAWARARPAEFLETHILKIAGGLLLALLAVFLLWPIAAVLAKGVYGAEGVTSRFYAKFFSAYYYRSLVNTLLLGLLTTATCITAGFCIAYLTTRGPRFLRGPLKWLTLLPLIAPPYIFALSIIMLFGRSGFITQLLNLDLQIFGFTGVVIAQTLGFVPLAYLIIENVLASVDSSLEDSAANLGASEGRVLRTITLPLVVPGFVKGALVVYAMAVSEFGNVAILAGRTPFLAPDIYTLVTGIETDFHMAGTLSAFLLLPVAMIFLLQHYLWKDKGYVTISGRPVYAEPRRTGWLILAPLLMVALITVGLIVLSFAVVGVGAFTRIVGIDNTLTLAHVVNWRANHALVSSVKVSALAGVLGAALGVVIAYVVVRGEFTGRSALEGVCLAGFAVPGTVLGIGYLLAFNSPPILLTGTMMILVLNSAFRFAAVGMEAAITKLQQLSIEVEEASRNLGASTAMTFRRVVLPIIFPAAVYGFIYVFMTTMVSLSAVVFLTSPAYPLVAVFIFQWAQYGYIGLASATTVKVIVIVSACLGIVHLMSRWTGFGVARGD